MTKHLGSLALGAMSVALTLTLALGGHVASGSASSARSGDLHIEKNCSSIHGSPGWLLHHHGLEPAGDPGQHNEGFLRPGLWAAGS